MLLSFGRCLSGIKFKKNGRGYETTEWVDKKGYGPM